MAKNSQPLCKDLQQSLDQSSWLQLADTNKRKKKMVGFLLIIMASISKHLFSYHVKT